ncbi:ABC transporter permease [Salisediminibacterium halotolerans]|uniref:ABC transporter permease n=1 Tax=Salisediminibacterium halotolerans TaxID=517425 RepID=UPI000EAEE5EC|nr:iron export ABC transporter permease subunit FetB [Salisediminibacterium halotolerans]RLJ78324.1 putative ABC transport system permease protein [Actinophytocola xinjiangensis]RPE88337.1 putative ABC transport system permease protein [Salisediminibacterium halotolerans]TWG37300.1 putative ABC transport system permease protein [Salisediminibacterium halotolerans]GEL09134.1 iron export ABC transporter permease subunit FetB [Salisediminibacterium halotolerans]
MDEALELSFYQVLAAYVFVLILLLIVRLKGIPREKEIVIATVRMTLQLVLVGFILIFLFENIHPLLTVLAGVLMFSFAVHNVYQRTNALIGPRMKKIIALSMAAGILSCLMFFIVAVMNLSPWYDPRYFIPIAGMIIGNSMTGITLGVNNLNNGMDAYKDRIEGALMLGAAPKTASKQVLNEAFDAAMLPTINSMVGMGIVFLPGMMTGQILAGASPLVAINYQIAIMLGVTGSVSLSVLLYLHLSYRVFFNDRQQLTLSEKTK